MFDDYMMEDALGIYDFSTPNYYSESAYYTEGYVAGLSDFLESTQVLFEDGEPGGYKLSFKMFDLSFTSYANKHPELKEAGIDVKRLNLELRSLGGKMAPTTGKTIFKVLSVIQFYWNKIASWLTVASVPVVIVPVVGLMVLISALVNKLVDALWAWALAYGDYHYTEKTLRKIISNAKQAKVNAQNTKSPKDAKKFNKQLDKVINDAQASINKLKNAM